MRSCHGPTVGVLGKALAVAPNNEVFLSSEVALMRAIRFRVDFKTKSTSSTSLLCNLCFVITPSLYNPKHPLLQNAGLYFLLFAAFALF